MAMRGEQLGVGYVENIGMVRIFHDMDNTKMFFVIDRKGVQRYIRRDRVQFRKARR